MVKEGVEMSVDFPFQFKFTGISNCLPQ